MNSSPPPFVPVSSCKEPAESKQLKIIELGPVVTMETSMQGRSKETMSCWCLMPERGRSTDCDESITHTVQPFNARLKATEIGWLKESSVITLDSPVRMTQNVVYLY
ncbi:hypothetical protein NQZ68_001123 [Dissostichus eleginoides]|nr:hypothetical protein NQZ68_001123 [Dissostichus eleginoides]